MVLNGFERLRAVLSFFKPATKKSKKNWPLKLASLKHKTSQKSNRFDQLVCRGSWRHLLRQGRDPVQIHNFTP